jgi:DNA-binding beta-propeller fold protein YncE
MKAIVLFGVAAMIAGCETQLLRPAATQEAILGPIVWPQPPNPPRILFVKAVTGPRDLGIEPTFWERVVQIFAGKEEAWFIRPTGVAVRGSMIYVADPGAQALWILDPQAGRFKRIEKAGEERLISPVAVTPAQNDLIYLADSFLKKVFIFHSNGTLKGTIAHATLERPAGVGYDEAGDRLYVADSATHRVWIFSGDGRAVGAIGGRGVGDGEFNFPTYVMVSRDGTLWVTDSMGFRVQCFSAAGTFAGKFGQHGDTSGDFAMPKGIALDSKGHIYVVDALFDAVQIFDRQGQYLLTFGERGIKPGEFWLPGGIFIDAQDRIYIADSYNQRIQIFQYVAGGSDE